MNKIRFFLSITNMNTYYQFSLTDLLLYSILTLLSCSLSDVQCLQSRFSVCYNEHNSFISDIKY